MSPPGAGARRRTGARPLTALALAAYRHPARVAWLALAVVLWSLHAASGLRLNADLAALLPADFPSVQALSRLAQRAGAAGYVVVVAEGAEPEKLRRYADELGTRVERLASIHHVEVRRPGRWLESRSLQLAPLPQLEAFTERLEERVDWEIQRHNPLFFDLGDDGPPSIELAQADDSTQGRWLRRQADGDYYEDATRGMIAVLARPLAAAADLSVAARTIAEVEQVVNTLGREAIAERIHTSLTGRYQKQLDQKRQIQRDLTLTSALALLFVLLYLGWHFRRAGALLELGLPLLVGVVATFGVVGAAFGELNILTAFIGAILLGLGIDHGIHLLSSFERWRAAGWMGEEALERAFATTGRGVTLATLTTAAGFLGLALSQFRTFRQFGLVAAVGMLSILLCYWVGLPALLRLSRGRRLQLRLSTASRRATPIRSAGSGRRRRPRWTSVGVASALLLLAALPARHLGFDADFAALEDANLASFRLDRLVNEIVGHSQTPTLILTDSDAEERAVSARLRDAEPRREALARRAAIDTPTGDAPTIDMVASIADLIDRDPEPRTRLLQRIRHAADRIPDGWVETPEDREALARLREMAERPALRRERLPREILQRLGSDPANGSSGAVLVYPAISLSRGDLVLRHAAVLRSVAPATAIAGEVMVLADILETVRRESRGVLGLALLGIFLTLWGLKRRLRPTLMALGSAVLSLVAGLGALAALGIELNYLSMVAIPVLFGVAVDGAVHLVEQAEHDAGALNDARRAIAASLATTALGFGALLIADHPGLRSLGLLALLGLAANALVSLWLLPAVLELAPRLGGLPRLVQRAPPVAGH